MTDRVIDKNESIFSIWFVLGRKVNIFAGYSLEEVESVTEKEVFGQRSLTWEM
jgi:hypothetical protein